MVWPKTEAVNGLACKEGNRGQYKDEQAAYVNLGVLKVCPFRPRQGEDRAYRRKTALQRFMLEHVPKLPNKLSEISDKINFIIDREIGRKGLPR